MNIRPIGERVVIKPMQKEEKTQSGILLPDSAQEKPIEGEVVAVGPGRINEKGERVPLFRSGCFRQIYWYQRETGWR